MGFSKGGKFRHILSGFRFHSVGFRCLGWEKTKARKKREKDLKRERIGGRGRGSASRRENNKLLECDCVREKKWGQRSKRKKYDAAGI